MVCRRCGFTAREAVVCLRMRATSVCTGSGHKVLVESGGVVELPPRTPLPAEAVPIFDRFARLVADRLNVPVALVSLVDVNGQVFPGAFGLPEPWLSERATPLSHSFCRHVITSGDALVVGNANDDALVANNPAVMELGVIAYAGVPLRTGDGPVVGAMCAIDHQPRVWTPEQLGDLTELAAACSLALRDSVQP
jgi:GAF domain-containing protein